MGLFDRIRGFFRSEPTWAPGLRVEQWRFVDDGEWAGRVPEGDEVALQIYADWLEERGDGRFELIRRAQRGERLTEFVDANAEALLGPLAARRRNPVHGVRPQLELTWTQGVLREASVRTEQVWADAEALLGLPIARHLTALGLGLAAPNVPLIEDPRALELGGRQLTRLVIGDFNYPDDSELSWALLGDLSAVWRAQPALRELIVQGTVEDLGDIDAPHLRLFVRESCGVSRKELEQVVRGRWPVLEHLELWLGGDDGAFGVDEVRPLLTRAWPALTSLSLCNASITDELVEPLLASPVLRQLKHLDLSKGCLSDAGAQRLLGARASLQHLESLDLSRNVLSAQHLAQLASLCPVVALDDQRLDEVDEDQRYVAVSE